MSTWRSHHIVIHPSYVLNIVPREKIVNHNFKWTLNVLLCIRFSCSVMLMSPNLDAHMNSGLNGSFHILLWNKMSTFRLWAYSSPRHIIWGFFPPRPSVWKDQSWSNVIKGYLFQCFDKDPKARDLRGQKYPQNELATLDVTSILSAPSRLVSWNLFRVLSLESEGWSLSSADAKHIHLRDKCSEARISQARKKECLWKKSALMMVPNHFACAQAKWLCSGQCVYGVKEKLKFRNQLSEI